MVILCVKRGFNAPHDAYCVDCVARHENVQVRRLGVGAVPRHAAYLATVVYILVGSRATLSSPACFWWLG